MDFRYKILMIFLLSIAFLGTCSGATASGAIYRAGVVYTVGDSNGWNIFDDYDNWTSTKKFHVGDTLVFTYDKVFLNLMQVSGQDYQSCNTKSPIAVYATGSDAIKLQKPDHYYFIGGRNFEPEWYALTLKDPSYCHAGQKLHVKVTLPMPNHPSAAPTPNSLDGQRTSSPSAASAPNSLYDAQRTSSFSAAPTPNSLYDGQRTSSPLAAPTPNSLYHGQRTSINAAGTVSVLPCLFIPLILLFFIL